MAEGINRQWIKQPKNKNGQRKKGRWNSGRIKIAEGKKGPIEKKAEE